MLTTCLMQPRAAKLFQEEMSRLYLNDKLSDVTFVIGDTKLPAHRFPLVVQSEYFENLLADPNKEIEIKDTSLEHFKLILHYVYRGSLELSELSIEDLFKVADAAKTYKLSQLVEFLDEHLATRVNADTLWAIIDNAISHSLEKTATSCMRHIEHNHGVVLAHKLFEQLSPTAIERILKVPLRVSEEVVFKALVNWIRANRDEHSTKVVPLLKLVKFDQLSREDLMLLVRPEQLITDKEFIDLLNEQTQSNEISDWSRVVCETGVEPINGLSFGHGLFNDNTIRGVKEDDQFKIFIDLHQQLPFNCVKMVLEQVGPYTVSISTDSADWELIIDRSNYDCRGLQELYFTERRARYIRINAASSTLSNENFEVSHLEVLSTPNTFGIDPFTTLFIPKEDVVLLAKYAKFVKTQNDTSPSLSAVKQKQKSAWGVPSSFGSPQVPATKAVVSEEEDQSTNVRNNTFTVILPQPYMIHKFQLCPGIGFSAWHKVKLEFSSNNKEWTELKCFDSQPVMFLRFTGPFDAIELIEKYYLEGSAATLKNSVE